MGDIGGEAADGAAEEAAERQPETERRTEKTERKERKEIKNKKKEQFCRNFSFIGRELIRGSLVQEQGYTSRRFLSV